jgi:hypothetical protein
MLNRQAIYHKTSLGAEAIANRHSGLSPRLRPLLIMVDGKRSFAELTALSTVIGDCEQLLSQLAQDGLIAPEGGYTVDIDMAELQPEETVPAPLAVATSLADAKRFASRLLVETLGPTADVLCMKVEATGNLAEFVGAVKRARDVLRDAKGAAAAERFVAQVELHTPQR